MKSRGTGKYSSSWKENRAAKCEQKVTCHDLMLNVVRMLTDHHDIGKEIQINPTNIYFSLIVNYILLKVQVKSILDNPMLFGSFHAHTIQ